MQCKKITYYVVWLSTQSKWDIFWSVTFTYNIRDTDNVIFNSNLNKFSPPLTIITSSLKILDVPFLFKCCIYHSYVWFCLQFCLIYSEKPMNIQYIFACLLYIFWEGLNVWNKTIKNWIHCVTLINKLGEP